MLALSNDLVKFSKDFVRSGDEPEDCLYGYVCAVLSGNDEPSDTCLIDIALSPPPILVEDFDALGFANSGLGASSLTACALGDLSGPVCEWDDFGAAYESMFRSWRLIS